MTTEHLNNLADALENIAHMEYPSDHHDRKNLAEAARILRAAGAADVGELMDLAREFCVIPSNESEAALESALRVALADAPKNSELLATTECLTDESGTEYLVALRTDRPTLYGKGHKRESSAQKVADAINTEFSRANLALVQRMTLSGREWQPIETAPKFSPDDVCIDIWGRHGRHADCAWSKPTYGSEVGWVYQESYDCNGPVLALVIEPVYWMKVTPPDAMIAAAQPGAQEPKP